MDKNKILPIIEIYGPVIQSEGSKTGIPHIILRTSGCTHRCFFKDGGWCFPKDTPILMNNFTYKNIQDIVIGDTVLTFDNGYIKPTNVLNCFERQHKTIYLILENGEKIECTPDHKFPTYTKSSNKFKLIEAKNLKGKLIKQIPNLNISPKIDNNYKKGYIKGVAKGDGSFQLPYRFKLECIDEDMIIAFSNYIKDIYGYDNNYKHILLDNNKKGNTYNLGYYRYFISNKDIIKELQKPITEVEKYGYIAGILDSEGNCSGNITIHQNDIEFINDIKNIIENEGFKSNIITQKMKYRGLDKIMYSLSILGGHKEKIRFINIFTPQINRKKQEALKFTRGGNKIKVIDILDAKENTNVYTLSTEYGYYIANNIFTKNCDSWYTSIHPEKGKYTLNDVEKYFKDNIEINHLMITGGSPTMHPELVNEIVTIFKEIHVSKIQPKDLAGNPFFGKFLSDGIITLETEGSHFVKTNYPIDLISLSPKFSNSIPVLGDKTPLGKIVDQKMIDQHNKFRLKIEPIKQLLEYHTDYHFKPVVNPKTQPEIWEEVENFRKSLNIPKNKTWIMPPGGTRDELISNMKDVIEFCGENNYCYSGRDHIIAFGDERER